jgi:hypothetical protein
LACESAGVSAGFSDGDSHHSNLGSKQPLGCGRAGRNVVVDGLNAVCSFAIEQTEQGEPRFMPFAMSAEPGEANEPIEHTAIHARTG